MTDIRNIKLGADKKCPNCGKYNLSGISLPKNCMWCGENGQKNIFDFRIKNMMEKPEIDNDSNWYIINVININNSEIPDFRLGWNYKYKSILNSCGPNCRINWYGKDKVQFTCESFSITFKKEKSE